jgi:para-nitrobenzyl esterase
LSSLSINVPPTMKSIFRIIVISVALALSIVTSCTTTPGIIDPVVRTESGLVQGVINETANVVAFKGLPYAAPPVGELRWQEPQPPPSWDGVRDASEFGASAIQVKQGSRLPWTEEFMVQNETSEDCLFLNIWTPAKTAEDQLAVFVYLHGGAYTEGSGAIDVYDGEELAKKGIVVVTINYRLGVLGFLAHPELTAESPHHVSGNYGILDQLAALKWISKNIAAFGGDPLRVTIAGQSAGAGSVNALIISPQAAGLFHRAITESGTRYWNSFLMSTALSAAEEQGVEFATWKGATSIAELRSMPAEELISTGPDAPRVRFGPVIDGYYQPADMKTVFAEGKQNDTPFMNGFNAGETRYMGDRDEKFAALYMSEGDIDTTEAEIVAGQEQTRLNTLLWMEERAKTAKTDAYGYFFDRAIPWPEHPEFGAFHTGEVPYVFNNLKMMDRPWTAVDTLVADRMSSYWVNFTKNGNPNGEGLPNWSAYYDNSREIMRIGEESGMIPVAGNDERFDFLKAQMQ